MAFPRIFAHRGASSLAPENTIASFAKAAEVGARWFEFDVDVIGDGSLIVIHDDKLQRTTTGKGGYYNLSFSDIRTLDAGKWFSDTYRFERIPEVADVISFANSANMGMNLEIKPCYGGTELREKRSRTSPLQLIRSRTPSASSFLPSTTRPSHASTLCDRTLSSVGCSTAKTNPAPPGNRELIC